MDSIVLFTNVTVNRRNAHMAIRRNRLQQTDPEANGEKKRNSKTILRPGPKLVPLRSLHFVCKITKRESAAWRWSGCSRVAGRNLC